LIERADAGVADVRHAWLSAFPFNNHRVRIAVSSPAFPDILKLAAHRSFDGHTERSVMGLGLAYAR
jgi:hypothetical protein